MLNNPIYPKISREFPITKLSENIPAHTCCVVVLKNPVFRQNLLYFQNIPGHVKCGAINSEFS